MSHHPIDSVTAPVMIFLGRFPINFVFYSHALENFRVVCLVFGELLFVYHVLWIGISLYASFVNTTPSVIIQDSINLQLNDHSTDKALNFRYRGSSTTTN